MQFLFGCIGESPPEALSEQGIDRLGEIKDDLELLLGGHAAEDLDVAPVVGPGLGVHGWLPRSARIDRWDTINDTAAAPGPPSRRGGSSAVAGLHAPA